MNKVVMLVKGDNYVGVELDGKLIIEEGELAYSSSWVDLLQALDIKVEQRIVKEED